MDKGKLCNFAAKLRVQGSKANDNTKTYNFIIFSHSGAGFFDVVSGGGKEPV